MTVSGSYAIILLLKYHDLLPERLKSPNLCISVICIFADGTFFISIRFPPAQCRLKYIFCHAGTPCRKESTMLKFFASEVVISKGYQNAPAIKFSDKGDFVRFRIGAKVYDPRAEEKHRWVNITVKCFNTSLVDRIRGMQLKEGSYINLVGRYDEDVWEDEQTKEKRSVPVIILDDIEFSGGGGKRSGDGQKTTNAQAATPAPEVPARQEDYQMPGNFTGYESFGGGNSFFNL